MPAKRSTNLKILFLSKSTPIFGGVERWLADLVYGLENLGHDCLVALADGALFHDPVKYHAAYPKLKITTLDGKTGSLTGRQLAVTAVLTQFKPDIVIPVSLGDGLSMSAYLKKKFRYKLIYPVHEVGQGVANDLSLFAPYIDATVFVDQSSEDYYASLITQANRTHLIPCGVLAKQVDRINTTDSTIIRIGHCGRIAKGKRTLDLVLLCDALDRAGQRYTLDIVGDGPQLEDLLTELGDRLDPTSSNTVTIHKSIDRDQLYRRFYNKIDLLIITSELETGPLVAFEAMTNRALVVTSDFSGRAENRCLIDEENCLVFPIGDMVKAADQIIRLARDNKLRERLRLCAYNYVSSKRNLSAMCESWSQIFMLLHHQRNTAISDKHNDWQTPLPLESVKERFKEKLRRILGLKFLHKSAGEEWPFFNSKVKKQ